MTPARPRAGGEHPGGPRTLVFADADAAALAAAERIASAARAAVRERGRFLVALSGGRTARAMLQALAAEPLRWECIHVFQADERAAPDGHPERNWTRLRADLLDGPHRVEPRLHPMSVGAGDLAAAADRYAKELTAIAGDPPVLDLVHLGLGDDGHTASLVPGDAALACDDAPVAATRRYRGWRRLTLTIPVLGAARALLWFVTGSAKREAVRRLLAGDRGIPAGRVPPDRAIVCLDAAAAGHRV